MFPVWCDDNKPRWLLAGDEYAKINSLAQFKALSALNHNFKIVNKTNPYQLWLTVGIVAGSSKTVWAEQTEDHKKRELRKILSHEC